MSEADFQVPMGSCTLKIEVEARLDIKNAWRPNLLLLKDNIGQKNKMDYRTCKQQTLNYSINELE